MKKILIAGAFVYAIALTGCFSGPCIQGFGPVVEEIRELDEFTAVSNTGSFEVRVTETDTFGVVVEAQENLLTVIETYVSGSTLIVKVRNGTCISPGAPVIVYVSLPELESIELTGSGRLIADIAESNEFECINTGSGLISIDSVFASTAFLKNTGSGRLEADAFYVDEIDMQQTGSGSIDAGSVYGAEEFDVNHTSSGRIYADLFEGYEVDIRVTGSGRVELAGDAEMADYRIEGSGKIDALELVTTDVKAVITGSGNIYTYAVETLDVVITGSGDVRYLGDPLVTQRVTGTGNVEHY